MMNLSEELRGFCDDLGDGGRIRLHTESETEQTRMNLRAVLRDVARAYDAMLAALRAYEYAATFPYGDPLHEAVLSDADAKRRTALASITKAESA